MSLTETDKDRVAKIWRQLHEAYCNADPFLWKGGEPEKRLSEEYNRLLSAEEQAYALELSRQYIAHLDEQGSDPVVERVDAAEALGERIVRRDDR